MIGKRVQGLLAVAVTGSMALAASVKIDKFSAAGTGLVENPNCDGAALLSYVSGVNKTEIRVMVTGFKPNTTYGVMVDSDLGGTSDPQAFTTNATGNGSYQANLQFDRSLNPVVLIYVWDGDPETVSEVSEAELRAVGQ